METFTLLRPLAFLVALAALGGASTAFAQATDTELATGTGTIFRPIVVSKNTDLSFGTVVRPLSGSGTVTVDPVTGDRTVGGDAAALGGSPTRATFTVGGEGGQTFSISVPANVVMTRSGGSETMVATLTPTSTTGSLDNPLGSNGSATFGVGGEVGLNTSTPAGAYSGTFVVTVQYN